MLSSQAAWFGCHRRSTNASATAAPLRGALSPACFACFGQVIDLVLLHGGDVSKFAGDAMLVVFAPTPGEQADAAEAGGEGDGGLAAATRRAARCVQKLVERFGELAASFHGAQCCSIGFLGGRGGCMSPEP